MDELRAMFLREKTFLGKVLWEQRARIKLLNLILHTRSCLCFLRVSSPELQAEKTIAGLNEEKMKKPEFYDCFRKKDLNSVDKNSVVSFDKPYCLLSSREPDHQKFTTTRAFAILNKSKSIRKETRISKHIK